MISQRDAFFGRLFQLAKDDKDIILISADMGAPSLDQWREELPSQYVNCGIAEANAIGIATGLTKVGKKCFVYAIEPFISLRCYEQIKLGPVAHKMPITIVGVGAGFSYEDSGPTHHTLEDISIMRALPGMQITTITDAFMAEAFAEISCDLDHPNYIRLDRSLRPNLYDEWPDLAQGFDVLIPSITGEYVFACGDMVHEVSNILIKQENPIGLVDVFTLPINERLRAIESPNKIITVEEHVLPGGFGSAVLEFNEEYKLGWDITRIGINLYDGYCYEYGGRDNIRKKYGINTKTLEEVLFRG